MDKQIITVGDALPQECARVRKLINTYLSLPGVGGRVAATIMEQALRSAEKAMIECDVVAILRAYRELREFKE